jgi:hypothetical protein
VLSKGVTQKTTVYVILPHNKMFCLSILPVLKTILVILVFEFTSVPFCFMSDVGAVSCFGFDSIAQAVTLSWSMVFCKNIFTQISVGKHLSFSIVVTGIVTTAFRSVTV